MHNLAARSALMSESVGGGYTECMYHVFDGNCHINTGVTLTTSGKFYVDYSFMFQAAQNHISGISASGGTARGGFECLVQNLTSPYTHFYINASGSSIDLDTRNFINKKIDVLWGDSTVVKADGIQVASRLSMLYASRNGEFWIGDGKPRVQGYGLIGRLYLCKIKQESDLIRDFVPIVDKNGIPCFLEKVNNEVYYNEGTGTITAGPTV